VDVQALNRHHYGYKYLLTVIDVFSKYLHMVPLKSKSGKDVSAAFLSVLEDPRYLKPFLETHRLGSNRQGERIS
jgi:hypothetical protein